MNNLEHAYNQALESIKKGRSKEQALLEFSDDIKTELAPLLDISQQLLALPKNLAPRPAMQRKYALAPAKQLWLAWLHISKFAAVSMSLMLLLSAFTVTAYQVFNSTPGKALFSLKTSAERLQLILATSQDAKANLQVEIAQKRLGEAKQVFSNPASDQDQKTAALTALSEQTTSAIAQVNTVAAINPKSTNNSPLLNSLASINADQKTLLANIKTDSQIKAAANNALQTLNENAAKISQIKQYVAIADSSQSLATLSYDPNSVAVLGQISKLEDSQITVEKTSFILTAETIIKNSVDAILSARDLSLGQKVNVIGEKKPNGLYAQQIFIIPDENPIPEVRGFATTTSEATTAPESIKKPDSARASTTQSSATGAIDNSAAPAPQTTGVSGSFIPEDPASQFKP